MTWDVFFKSMGCIFKVAFHLEFGIISGKTGALALCKTKTCLLAGVVDSNNVNQMQLVY